jgi:hypothetical protein
VPHDVVGVSRATGDTTEVEPPPVRRDRCTFRELNAVGAMILLPPRHELSTGVRVTVNRRTADLQDLLFNEPWFLVATPVGAGRHPDTPDAVVPRATTRGYSRVVS